MSPESKNQGFPAVSALLLIALLPAFNLFVFGPLTIYLGNPEEFDIHPLQLLPGLIVLGALLAIALTAIGIALGAKLRQKFAAVLLAFGLLTWAQGAFLMQDYGVLDGRGIDWRQFGPVVWVDVVLWVALLAASIIFSRQVVRAAAFAAGAFIVVQSVPLTANLLESGADGEISSLGSPPEEIFHYSRGRNIVHVVLDNFQTDVFLELVEVQGLQDEFDGFVLYRENTAVVPHTSLAIPAIFSGKVYDGSMPAGEYYRSAMETGFHTRLLGHGYTVNLVPMLTMQQSPYTNYYQLPNVYAGSERDRLLRDYARLLDVSLFRQAPHGVRRWIYNGNNWRIRQWLSHPESGKSFQHRKFLADYIDNLEATMDSPAYHFIHLWPPHPPFTTLKSGRQADQVLPNTRENYLNEARPMVSLLVDFIAKLKELNVYDDTLIIFQSDHGGGFEPEFMPRRLLGLMAVKPIDARGPLRQSAAQTTVADTASIVMNQVGISDPSHSSLPADSSDNLDRSRRFILVNDNELVAIDINGSAYVPASYGKPRAIDMANGGRDYQFGQQARVGLLGQGARFLGKGWSAPNDRFVWSNSTVSTLLLNVRPPEHDLRLVIDLIPYVDREKLPEQRVDVRINGRPATEWIGTEQHTQQIKIDIPRGWIDGTEMEISFSMPNAAKPVDLGTGGDKRQLGIALVGFRIDEIP